MLPDPKVKCPATAFERSCRDVVAECDCPKFVHVQFVNPQNGEKVDKYGCADAFMPLLTILGAQASNQTGAAVESLRNELVKEKEETAAQRGVALETLVRLSGREVALK